MCFFSRWFQSDPLMKFNGICYPLLTCWRIDSWIDYIINQNKLKSHMVRIHWFWLTNYYSSFLFIDQLSTVNMFDDGHTDVNLEWKSPWEFKNVWWTNWTKNQHNNQNHNGIVMYISINVLIFFCFHLVKIYENKSDERVRCPDVNSIFTWYEIW